MLVLSKYAGYLFVQGRHIELLVVGVCVAVLRVRRLGGLEGVTGRSMASTSARLMN
jgi:hypothetical protein